MAQVVLFHFGFMAKLTVLAISGYSFVRCLFLRNRVAAVWFFFPLLIFYHCFTFATVLLL